MTDKRSLNSFNQATTRKGVVVDHESTTQEVLNEIDRR